MTFSMSMANRALMAHVAAIGFPRCENTALDDDAMTWNIPNILTLLRLLGGTDGGGDVPVFHTP